MKLIVCVVILMSWIASCNSQQNKVDDKVNEVLKANDFYIDNIDLLIVLNEVEYLLKNDLDITSKWESFVLQMVKDVKRNNTMKINSHYLKKYINQYGTEYLKSKFVFLENVKSSDEENIQYTFFNLNGEEVVGVREMDYLFYAFILKDKFFKIVEEETELKMIFNNMLKDEKFKLYLTLFDTPLCSDIEFKKRKIEFLTKRFQDCESIYGKLFYTEITNIDINKDY